MGFDSADCPICGEPVKANAQKCVHCGEFIHPGRNRSCWPKWTGFAHRTLWEWMSVLVFPFALAVVSTIFNERVVEEQRLRRTALAESTQEFKQMLIARATATSKSSEQAITATVAVQSTQNAESTATRSRETAEAMGTATAETAKAGVFATATAGGARAAQAARETATAQAVSVATAFHATEVAILATTDAEHATQVAGAVAKAVAAATADASEAQATLSVLPTSESDTRMPTPTPVPSPTRTPCPTPAFFADVSVSPELGCPTEARTSQTVFQEYPSGILVWFKEFENPRIYSFLDDGDSCSWAKHPDDGPGKPPCEAARDCPLKNGFGRLWCGNDGLQIKLGIPEGEERSGGENKIQQFEHGMIFKYDGKHGFILDANSHQCKALE